MSRRTAIDRATAYYDSGAFLEDLRRRVAHRTESQEAGRGPELRAYLDEEIAAALRPLGFSIRVLANPLPAFGPFLLAERIERADLPTVLIYGHGDVIRGYDARWREGLSPWRVIVEGDRVYGRGTADNKGQHSVNIGALAEVLAARAGRLGFNAKIIIETGEEAGSPGLREICAAERGALKADLLVASDGPRLSSERPTIFLGSRGAFNFDLSLHSRDGAHHSGNWGGLLRNPGTVLANAIAGMVDARGRILVEGLRPPPIPASVKAALADIAVGGGPGDPDIDVGWGEPDLSPAERVFGWNSLEVLAFKTGEPDAPANAIPAHAMAHCQLRFVVGCDPATFVPVIRAHLDAAGLSMVEVRPARMTLMNATRLDPEDPWVGWALRSLARTTGKTPALLPNLGGSLPNDIFADLLGLPTIWVPHSYPGCSQHAPDEHLLGSIAREGLQIMAGLFWDLGEEGAAIAEARRP
jgi:acetylornithine deacetylase/succinyl-diaminopimelate desuccinylase-like protein